MRQIAAGTWLVDLLFQGHPQYIACYALETGSGLALVDPGPTSTLDALEEGLAIQGRSLEDVEAILLTHIHLDHAGATGTILDRNPDIGVYVHARGAGHMVDPTRLLASATRLYGDAMDHLWGEFLAVPGEHVHALEGGERLVLGDRTLDVAYTPGHAIHHVSYFEEASATAWVGDVAGIRIDAAAYVLPVTPPPDIDLEAWASSIARIREWEPETLCPTHFGPASPAAAHLDEHDARLAEWAASVARDLQLGTEEDRAAEAFRERVRAEIRATVGPGEADCYLRGGGLADSWRGLARYWRKRDESRPRR